MSELVVRVQWAKGFTDVSDGGSGRRRTIPFNAGGNVETRSAAVALGQAVLASLGPASSVDVDVGDTASWPDLGDAITTAGFSGTAKQRMVGRRVGTDRNGFAHLAPTLGSRSQIIAERQKLAIERLSSGGTGGRSAGVAPSSAVGSGMPNGTLRAISVPPWVLSGVRVDDGPVWPADAATVVVKTEALVTVAPPADDIIIAIYVNNVQQAYMVLPQGATSWSILGSLLIAPGQKLQVRVTNIGANTETQLENTKLTVKFTAAPAELRVQERKRR